MMRASSSVIRHRDDPLETHWLPRRVDVRRPLDRAGWATRRAGRPTIPRSFWIISLMGSAMVTSYFIWGKNDRSAC